VHAQIIRELRMKRCQQDMAVANQHRLACVLAENLDVRPELAHSRCPDEDPAER
jgi:hypothetical protein